MVYTLLFVIVTVLTSIAAFNNDALNDKLILWPRRMDNPAEYHRLLSSGFIHADWNHLIFNMLTLYFAGQVVEGAMGLGIEFVIMYLTGIVISSLPSFLKNRHNQYYRSLGASGGVSTVLFFSIYFMPWGRISLMFLPIGIPSILFAVLYLAYTAYMSKRGGDNVNHDAHLWGSLYGLFYAVLIDPSHGRFFINELMHPR